jgi:uncharacterized protein YjiS (DUF1127 family)
MTQTFTLASTGSAATWQDRPRPSSAQFVVRFVRYYFRWRRDCRELLDLDDRQLRDIGLTRGDVSAACKFDLSRM